MNWHKRFQEHGAARGVVAREKAEALSSRLEELQAVLEETQARLQELADRRPALEELAEEEALVGVPGEAAAALAEHDQVAEATARRGQVIEDTLTRKRHSLTLERLARDLRGACLACHTELTALWPLARKELLAAQVEYLATVARVGALGVGIGRVERLLNKCAAQFLPEKPFTVPFETGVEPRSHEGLIFLEPGRVAVAYDPKASAVPVPFDITQATLRPSVETIIGVLKGES